MHAHLAVIENLYMKIIFIYIINYIYKYYFHVQVLDDGKMCVHIFY